MVSNEDALSFLEKNSVYANRWLSAHPDWRDWLGERIHTPVDTNQIDQLLLPISQDLDNGALDEAALMSQLRLSRQQLMLWIGCRDLNGIASLLEVTQSLSYFAEQAVGLTVRYVRADLQARFGLPWARTEDYELPFLIVGMGKLGGRELNLSSDIDLIFLYEEEGETQQGANSISNHEWFTKLGRRLIKIISEHDAYGFVFRVDMRLRPNGDSGQNPHWDASAYLLEIQIHKHHALR